MEHIAEAQDNINAASIKGSSSKDQSESTTQSEYTVNDKDSGDKVDDPDDEYHYLKNGEYTSELFKVVVQNIPKRISYGCLRQTMTTVLGFTPKKVKFNSSNDYAFLAMRNEEERQKAIDLLNKHNWKGNVLICKKAAPAKDPFVRERKRKAKEEQDGSKKSKFTQDDNIPPEERILHVVCPYASYSYEEQLKLKEEEMRSCIQKLTSNMKREKIGSSWIYDRKDKLCLDLLPIIKSPVLQHYRNKVEFTIGKGPDEKDNVVGFRLGSYREGSMLIVEPTKCINCSKESIIVAQEFQVFIQSLSHPSYNRGNHVGLWQQLTVRTCTTGDVLVIIQVNLAHLSQEQYDELIPQITRYFRSEERSIKVSSVYISSSSQKNNNIDTFKFIFGNEYVYEKLLGLQFRISPDAFFQVNTPGAELLYRTVHEWCDTEQHDACVLDVCCGTGTIGLCIANNTSLPVVGIEIVSQAVKDAIYNATANGVENATFICGPAEKVLHKEIKQIKKKNIIAVVDPPRAGLHREVIQLLRACTAINKIVYVSCSPKQASNNFISLCRPESKRFKGAPFKTTRAIPVDLFPQTPHCELIVELERLK